MPCASTRFSNWYFSPTIPFSVLDISICIRQRSTYKTDEYIDNKLSPKCVHQHTTICGKSLYRENFGKYGKKKAIHQFYLQLATYFFLNQVSYMYKQLVHQYFFPSKTFPCSCSTVRVNIDRHFKSLHLKLIC